MKVPQHTSDVQCPIQSNAPITSQKCEVKQVSLAAESCNDNIKNQDEENTDCGGACKPCIKAESSGASAAPQPQQTGAAGFAVKNLLPIRLNAFMITVVSVAGALSIYLWIRFRGRAK